MEQQEKEFTELVAAHKSTIYSVCLMFSKDEDEVEDLFQNVLISLWRGYASFRAESKPSTWIWRVSLNTCLNLERKRKRRAAAQLALENDYFDARDEDSRQIRQLHERISRLRPFDRAIVLLWLENMSYDEIAAIVGITPKNVSVRLYRIKEELKRMSNPETNEK